MIDFEADKDGVGVLWEYEEGWLVYEYLGFLKKVYPAKRASIGHRCYASMQYGNNDYVAFANTTYAVRGKNNEGIANLKAQGVGFVNAQVQGKNICGWCDGDIPDEVHGVMALYNYGSEGERHDQG